MRCDDIRERIDALWEGNQPAEVGEHLAQCAACSRYLRDLRLVRSGLALWRQEAVPEPSLGFAERLVRQLGEVARAPSVADFFERVGRRVVYATLALTLLVLLGLALPSTGPVRGRGTADLLIPSQEASAYSDPMGESAALESPEAAPVEAPAPAATDEVK